MNEPVTAPTLASRVATLFRRRTSGGAVVPEIEGLRAFAITLVLIHHAVAAYLIQTKPLGEVQLPADWLRLSAESLAVRIGYLSHFGVPLFFVISGFVLALPFARHHLGMGPPVALRAYYLRRLRRLEIPYLLALLVFFIAIVVTQPNPSDYVPHLVASAFYLHGPIYGEPSWVMGIAWSLEIEVQFYLLAPFLTRIFRVRDATRRRVLLVAIILATQVLGLCLRYASYDYGWGWARLGILNYSSFFFAGFLVADLYLCGHLKWPEDDASVLTRSPMRSLLPFMADAAIVACAFAVAWLLREWLSWQHVAIPLLVFAAYAFAFRSRIVRAILTSGSVVIYGGWCYSIYLYHAYLLGFLLTTLGSILPIITPWPLELVVHFAIAGSITVAACALAFALIERPCMSQRRSTAGATGT